MLIKLKENFTSELEVLTTCQIIGRIDYIVKRKLLSEDAAVQSGEKEDVSTYNSWILLSNFFKVSNLDSALGIEWIALSLNNKTNFRTLIISLNFIAISEIKPSTLQAFRFSLVHLQAKNVSTGTKAIITLPKCVLRSFS